MSKETESQTGGIINIGVGVLFSFIGTLVAIFSIGPWKLVAAPFFLGAIALVLIFALGSSQLNEKAENVLLESWRIIAYSFLFGWLIS